jgi:POT family proton-dependent oligopeptide transporter
LAKPGFQKSFWAANGMELFERLAYYGQATILSIFLRNHLGFNEVQAGQLSSIFGFLIYFFPIFAGALADKYGFKKAFTFAFFILTIGYFLIGSTGMAAFHSFYAGKNLFLMLTVILIFTAIGGSFIKPSVLGTISLTTTHETKSFGYAIYYWLVNIGGAVGPLIAYSVRQTIGIEMVYMVSALSCFLMLLATLFIYKEPGEGERVQQSFGDIFKNLILVLTKVRFIIFLFIFSFYWVMFWGGIYVIIPYYITDYVSKDAPFELIESVGAWTIIVLQLIVNRLTKHFSPITAIIIGFAFTILAWGIIIAHPSIPVIIAGLVIFSIGEQTQAPRYYEYIADLAPKGQAALFQGYAFLPIAIGWLFGGTLGGWLYKVLARESHQPGMIFVVLACIGVFTTILMWLYNQYVKRNPLKASA